MAVTIPCMPDDLIRLHALQMACHFSDDPAQAMLIADELANYIDNGGGSVRVVCDGTLAGTFADD